MTDKSAHAPFLFVGGPADGQLIGIAVDLSTFQMERQKPLLNTRYDATAPIEDTLPDRVFYTKRCFNFGSVDRVLLFAIQGMSDYDVMRNLVSGYRSGVPAHD